MNFWFLFGGSVGGGRGKAYPSSYHPWESGTGWETMGSGVPQVPKNSRGYIWMFPKIGGKHPQNGWFIMFIYNGKLSLKWMIWGKHPLVFGNTHISS